MAFSVCVCLPNKGTFFMRDFLGNDIGNYRSFLFKQSIRTP